MQLRNWVLSAAVLLCSGTLAVAQAPTPTPVDSNIAVSTFAQSTGQSFLSHCACTTGADCASGDTCSGGKCSGLCNADSDCITNACVKAGGVGVTCTTPGGEGCGGCYPVSINAALLDRLPEVNPEWQPIGPMISGGPDTSLPPLSAPVTVHGTVALTKLNVGGDFPGSHYGDDQNTFIQMDPADNGITSSGEYTSASCPGENCGVIEMELEFKKYPLFAWAGEGDRINAQGRWIFDCGHPDPADPIGGCSNNAAIQCAIDSDCGTGHQCNNPVPNFNYRSELHPPQAIVVMRNKSNGKTPASRADVYISGDGGGAGDLCTNTHLVKATDVLFTKNCFLNHCSVTTGRSCATKKDCPGTEQCLKFDDTEGGPVSPIGTVNATDFAFDLPLPPPPVGPATLKIKTKSFKPSGGLMPKPTFVIPTPPLGPTPSLHVIVPMSHSLSTKTTKMPNVFAERITAYWKEDTTKLTHVQVKFQKLNILNPLKEAVGVIDPRQCTNPGGGLSGGATCTSNIQCTYPGSTCVSGKCTPVTCTTNADCQQGTCNTAGTPCSTDSNCKKTDFCTGASLCVGGIVPGWELWGEVNGDWIQFLDKTKPAPLISTLGGPVTSPAVSPFIGPPYTVQPEPGFSIPLKGLTFDEYVPSSGSVHLASTGHSVGCNDVYLYGHNLKTGLAEFGLVPGAACFGQTDDDPGRLEVTHVGPYFAQDPANALCTGSSTAVDGVNTATPACCTAAGKGTCDANLMCTGAGTPFACCDTGSPTPTGSCRENDLCTAAGTPFPCCTGSGTGVCSDVTCTPPALPSQATVCTATSGTGDGGVCSTATTRLCVVDADCPSGEKCSGNCSDTGDLCNASTPCDPGATCEYGKAFSLTYSIQLKP